MTSVHYNSADVNRMLNSKALPTIPDVCNNVNNYCMQLARKTHEVVNKIVEPSRGRIIYSVVPTSAISNLSPIHQMALSRTVVNCRNNRHQLHLSMGANSGTFWIFPEPCGCSPELDYLYNEDMTGHSIHTDSTSEFIDILAILHGAGSEFYLSENDRRLGKKM